VMPADMASSGGVEERSAKTPNRAVRPRDLMAVGDDRTRMEYAHLYVNITFVAIRHA
jgi:hypothetical protein